MFRSAKTNFVKDRHLQRMIPQRVKKYVQKRKYSYVYILYRIFDRDVEEFCRAMRIPQIYPADVKEWDEEYGELVASVIDKEDTKAAQVRDANGDIPDVAKIKQMALRRLQDIIDCCDDPAKVANTFKILEEHGKEAEAKSKARSAADEIAERLASNSGKRKVLATTEREREAAKHAHE